MAEIREEAAGYWRTAQVALQRLKVIDGKKKADASTSVQGDAAEWAVKDLLARLPNYPPSRRILHFLTPEKCSRIVVQELAGRYEDCMCLWA
eukprot:1189772-Prorocentrum_minimum.AAC.5